jgi:DNA-directed RNA polymerase subunit RPC12/RpoP
MAVWCSECGEEIDMDEDYGSGVCQNCDHDEFEDDEE